MAASRKVHVISTKYFMCINCGYYMIYLQNIKFMQSILWPGGAYTDNTYATKPESRSHIRIPFMNHDYIGSFWQCQMSQKAGNTKEIVSNLNFVPNKLHLYSRRQADNMPLSEIKILHKAVKTLFSYCTRDVQ